jgi:RNA polymerase sigma-70 factor (ECF subfamily)
MATIPVPDDTTWSLLQTAAGGDARARTLFFERYQPVVRACLSARWHGQQRADIDDAAQEVFLECLREGGVLDRVRADEVQRFRAFLNGVVGKVAQRFEERGARRAETEGQSALDRRDPTAIGEGQAHVLDSAWARTILKNAAERQTLDAKRVGPAAEARLEILRLRFHEGLEIREIAERRNEDAARVHHDYARAREEFLDALKFVVGERYPGSPEAVGRVCGEILGLLR